VYIHCDGYHVFYHTQHLSCSSAVVYFVYFSQKSSITKSTASVLCTMWLLNPGCDIRIDQNCCAIIHCGLPAITIICYDVLLVTSCMSFP